MGFFNYRKVAYEEHTLMEKLFQLRFKVYCEECSYERSCDYQDSRESDEYDPHSVHFSATEADSGKVVGTVRIIRHSENVFPAIEHCRIHPSLVPDVPSWQIGEISRLAVSKEYRRQAATNAMRNRKVVELQGSWQKKFQDDLVCGLYQCIYQECIDAGITHLYAVMAEPLHKILQGWGLQFTQIGPTVDYHGQRTPYLLKVADNMHLFSDEEQKRAAQG